MASKLFKLVILGAPGSGKGTISNRIIRDFKFKHFSVGDILRSHVEKDSNLGKRVSSYLLNGSLVPDELMIQSILDVLSHHRERTWLLDGFPRTLEQAQALYKCEKVSLVLNLEVPNEVIIDRLKDRWIHLPSGRIYNLLYNPPKEAGKDDITREPLIQREDDKPIFVNSRLNTYDLNTRPIKEFYKKKGLLKQFQGTESNEIYPRVKKFLEDNYLDLV